jgi:hypothetical protein
VLSDSRGRFQLEGLSEKTQAEIRVTHPDYIHEELTIGTTASLAPRFTHVLEPARPIEGLVRDRDTGQPLAGVALDLFVARPPDWRLHFPATTDARGRYRIIGVAWNRPSDLFANVRPPAASGYLPTQENREEWPAGRKDLRWDFLLKKGRLVRGRVIDSDSREAIAGATVTGGFGSHSAITGANGEFEIWVKPRLEMLFVDGPTSDYQRVTIERGKADEIHAYYPHGYARLSPAAEGTGGPVEVRLKKGATIAAQAIDPSGKALSDVVVSGLSLFAHLDNAGQTARQHPTGLFRMSSFVSGQSYRIFFIQNDRHLAGFADLVAKPGPAEPVNVVLHQTSSVRGKVVRRDGSGERRRRIGVQLLMSRDEVKLDTMEFLVMIHVMSYGLAAQQGGSCEADADGYFEIGDLMSGVRLYLTFLVSSNRVEYYPVDPLEPGEVRDLGAIKPIVLTVP